MKLLVVPDEESEEDSTKTKASEFLAEEGHLGEFVVCGEPTNLEIGVQSKGVLVLRIDVEGRAAHGSTPWLGENAVLKAIDLYRRILELPFASGRSELYDRPSINIGRIQGGDVVNKVPDQCRMAVEHPLPAQPGSRRGVAPGALAGRRGDADLRAAAGHARPRRAARAGAARGGALAEGRRGGGDRPGRCLGRRLLPRSRHPGDRVRPAGAGHHGPEEYVEIESLQRYRRILVEFARRLALG